MAVNLAASLAHYGKRVLLVDLDPQGNATTGSGIDKVEADNTVYGLLLGEYTLAATRVRAEGAYDVLPANRELAGAEIELIDLERREYRLLDSEMAQVRFPRDRPSARAKSCSLSTA
jgi:chromosome partitioning protein